MNSITANYKRGFEYVGGYLYFTNDSMAHKPHVFNLQTDKLEIPYAYMAKVEKFNLFGFIPTAIKVTTKDGCEHIFVVGKRGKVYDFLNSKIN